MINNPFDITKAVDYTDQELYDYWVDLNQKKGFNHVMKPTTLMPMIIIGSKGSGKTHIMKYYSYELQKIRCEKENSSIEEGLAKEKFIGIYIRCTSFNSEIFSGRGVSEEIWSSIHAYLWELWIGEKISNVLCDLKTMGVLSDGDEQIIVTSVLSYFHEIECGIETLFDLRNYFLKLQKQLIYTTQNFALEGYDHPDVKIQFKITQLTYGFPEILKTKIPYFKNKYIIYLVDELENFNDSQQRLVQSLIREKTNACTFRIGARPYGIRHYLTLNGEENHDGSEFEKLVLDEFLRNFEHYDEYIKEILNRRLRNSKLSLHKNFDIETLIENLSNDELLGKIFSKKESQSKRYLNKIKTRLDGIKSAHNWTEEDVETIMSNLRFDDDHVIERANVMLTYRAIKNKVKEGLLSYSKKIHDDALTYFTSKDKETMQHKVLTYYRQDLIDTMAREANMHPAYYGLQKLIELSCGTPRTILRLLKTAFKNQYFNTNKYPFEKEQKLSINSQQVGIEDTYNWFFEENRIPAVGQSRPVDAINRLGDYLRNLRFSDVPPQCSISIFSLDEATLSDAARETLDILIKYSYLIRLDSRRKKNSNDMLQVYRLNSILLPKWELALAKRGNVQLSSEEAELIFSPNSQKEYDRVFKKRLLKYTYPFKEKLERPQDKFYQTSLF